MNKSEFEKELENLINKYSLESGSDTPDFILAEYLSKCIDVFNTTTRQRELWYGRKPITCQCQSRPTENIVSNEQPF